MRLQQGTIWVRVLAGAAALTIAGALASTAGTAEASSTGCAFTNGCATLNGHNAAGDGVSMDAKAQNKTGLVIGYPDFGPGSKAFASGDPATSFDAVLHYGRGAHTAAYTDTGLQAAPFTVHSVCSTLAPVVPAASGGDVVSITTTGTNVLSVNTTDGATVTASSNGQTLTFTGLNPSGTVIVDESNSALPGCAVAYAFTVTSSALVTGGPAATDSLGITGPTYPVGLLRFTGSTVSAPPAPGGVTYTYSFTGLPAGIVTSGGDLEVDSSTAVPGTYTATGVHYAGSDGAQTTDAFELIVSAASSTVIGNGVPFYTFVYAPNGDWTSDCVTDVTGSGALRLTGCTLGKDQYQDFYALPQAGGGASDQLQTDPASSPVLYWIQDVLRHNDTGNNSCLTDPSVSNPLTPQTDAQDQTPPGGRQFYTNGSCTATANLWSWGT